MLTCDCLDADKVRKLGEDLARVRAHKADFEDPALVDPPSSSSSLSSYIRIYLVIYDSG